MLRRMSLPSTLGFRPRPAFSMPLAMSLTMLGSKGLMTICVGSGTVTAARLRMSDSPP